MRESTFALIAAVIYIAIIYALVRPGSNGPGLINTIFSTFSDLVRGTLGYSYDPSKQKWTAPQ